MLDIIIPVYNQKEDLERTINSIIENTFINFRIQKLRDLGTGNQNSIIIPKPNIPWGSCLVLPV